jgi:hypothetical protein
MRTILILLVLSTPFVLIEGCGGTNDVATAPQAQTSTSTPAEQQEARQKRAFRELAQKSSEQKSLLAIKAAAHLKAKDPSVEPDAEELAAQAVTELEEAQTRPPTK